jgi:hypothetical protein
LEAEEQEPIMVKGFSRPVKTYHVVGIREDQEEDTNHFHHEDEGVKISIRRDNADPMKTIEALERALSLLGKNKGKLR